MTTLLAETLRRARAVPAPDGYLEGVEVMVIGMARIIDGDEHSIGNAEANDTEPQWWDVCVRLPDATCEDRFDIVDLAEGLQHTDAITLASALSAMLLGDPDSYDEI